ncbi:hypothetical protein ACFPIF_02300 [Brevundimonas faecalis]|uniref:hypothetical protein n=1 Tax=Brevundimonas faecalis TaxID=947378 RepID=UPI00361AAACA
MVRPDADFDPQDQAEVYDETHLDDEGDGDLSLEEIDDVLDVTRERADIDPYAPPRAPREEIDAESEEDSQPASDEVDLVYAGLMRNQRGAQASAAHWEARRLSDDDIADLGYGPDEEETP